MSLWLCEMKYSSHKKWLSSLSSTALHNECPVRAETRDIVTRQQHTRSPEDSLGVEVSWSALTTTSHAGMLSLHSTWRKSAFNYASLKSNEKSGIL